MSNPATTVNEKIGISVSLIKDAKQKAYKTFNPRHVTIDELAFVIKHHVWSPVIFKDSHRRKASFESCDVLAFDFDDGYSIEDAINLVQTWNSWAIIGTTKSHQKEKSGEAPCDRFRMILRASSSCVDREQYEYNMELWLEKLKADKSCKDGARYFYPCEEIVFKQTGDTIDWHLLPENYIRELDRFKKNQKAAERHRHQGTIPRWIQTRVSEGVTPGNRHRYCYAIGAALSEIGYGIDEITEFICRGPLAAIGVQDVRRCVENGTRKIIGDFSNASSEGSGEL